MQLSLQSFQTMVRNMAAAAQGACATALDFTVGAVELALTEACSGIGLWLQWQILLVLQATRLATSNGPDVDTFVNDFTVTREPAVASSGAVTFSRFTATMAALIPVGLTVRTADLTLTFAVIADTTNSLWSTSLNGYLLPAGTTSGTVPVQCTTAGRAGNVQIGAINVLGAATAGVDTVTNAAAYANGQDAESDAALRTRFQNFINTREQGTKLAVGYAIESLQQGLTYDIAENVDPQGNYEPGNFVVTIDNGTGSPPSGLLTQVYSAIDAIRPICSTFYVEAPTVITANISLTITAAAGYTKSNLIGPVASAIEAYVNELGMSTVLSYFALAGVPATVEGVAKIESLLVNGATADIGGSTGSVVRAGTLAVA